MTARKATGVEQAIDGAAAAAFAGCVAWSALLCGLSPAVVAATGMLTALGVFATLTRVSGIELGVGFTPVGLEYDDPVDDTLLLEDRLIAPGEHSQVVRLFAVGDQRATHAPGELAQRIDQFLGGNVSSIRAAPAQPDAAHELYEALAQIRQTLR